MTSGVMIRGFDQAMQELHVCKRGVAVSCSCCAWPLQGPGQYSCPPPLEPLLAQHPAAHVERPTVLFADCTHACPAAAAACCCSHLCEQPAWYKELAPQQDDDERENKLVGGTLGLHHALMISTTPLGTIQQSPPLIVCVAACATWDAIQPSTHAAAAAASRCCNCRWEVCAGPDPYLRVPLCLPTCFGCVSV